MKSKILTKEGYAVITDESNKPYFLAIQIFTNNQWDCVGLFTYGRTFNHKKFTV